MRKSVFLGGLVLGLLLFFSVLSAAQHPARTKLRQHVELYRLLSRLPGSDFFNQWLAASGELPPDFEALPSRFFLPDPLKWTQSGEERVVTRSDWPERRRWLAAGVEKWLLGTAPPPPGNVVADILEKGHDRGHEVWSVRLRFGPNHAAHLSVTLFLPKDQSQRSPIFLCDNKRYIRWAEQAMAGGFGFAVHGARDREDESFTYADLFGEYDWSSFRRRGWSASRVVDWLVTLPFVDERQIYIGGHSRSAKAAIAGAIFDERIAGLIASSPGSGGGGTPYRYADQSYFGESAELLTRRFPDWVHSRVRFFSGREDKLPTDSNILYALMAPRPLLMSTATEDSVESTWTVEQVYKITQPVYRLLGVPKNIAFRYRPGLHSTDDATSVAFSRFLLAASSRETEDQVRNLARLSIRAAETREMRFGGEITGYVYFPEGEGKRPAVVWLPPFQTSRGFIASGYRNATPTPEALVQSGFVTVAYDPIGTGSRQAERRTFYERHPSWSLMGKMVQDARHAVDAVLQVPEVDPERIYLYGYAMGGMVAIFTAALDDRVAGIVTVAGFTPMRTDTDDRRTGGIRRLSHLYGWLPRLGAFIGDEDRIPVDFHELLASVAPRPVLVIAPSLDRYSDPEEVAEAVLQARKAFSLLDAEMALELQTPYDENRLTDDMQWSAISRLKTWAAAVKSMAQLE